MKLSNYISERSCTISGYLCGVINAMENSLVRMRYYEQTNDNKFLSESLEWLEVAQIYMREINNDKIPV